ncbi:MAG TPA: hypothetical protein VGB77_11625 [Abditibacteriaceae bacterium]|jgi:hypothetical protein
MKQSYDEFEDDSDDNLDEFSSEEDYEAQGAYGDKDDYGLCPVCGGPGETVSVGVRQWVVCHRDRVKWRLGLGFFALFQRREKWDQTPREVASYREVQPLRETKKEIIEAKPQDDEEARFRRMMGE